MVWSYLWGIIGHHNQLGSGHRCTCAASCKACPLLVQVISAVVIPITGNSNSGLQQFKGISIAISTPYPLDQTLGFNNAMNLTLLQLGFIHRLHFLRVVLALSGALSMRQFLQECTCCGMDLSTGRVALRCTCSSVAFYPLATIPLEVHVLQRRHKHGHSTCSGMGLSTATGTLECSAPCGLIHR